MEAMKNMAVMVVTILMQDMEIHMNQKILKTKKFLFVLTLVIIPRPKKKNSSIN